jgi:hypothetical protein
MKPTETFKVNAFGDTYTCRFVPGVYGNGNLALQMMDAETDELFCAVTVNPGETIPNTQIAVKNYSENTGILKTLLDLGIVGKCVRVIPSGFVRIPVHELTPSGQELFAGII